ncbi:MAG: serine hydrolase [Aeromicrobium sp.]|uniref:serine hydrolase domain-containing protein n=1 Tax=Aeromicrobium sp. TaxID=1871063 RepID=UPI0039E3C3FC
MARQTLTRPLIAVAAALAVLVGLAYGAAAVMHIPAPHDLVRLQLTGPSAQGTRFAARPVTNSGPVIELPHRGDVELPATVPWKGEDIGVQDMLDTTHTRAFVVLHDGQVVHEWYSGGVDADTRLSSWSVAKSIVSLLVGQAIDRGALSEDDRLVDLLPDLKTGGTAYDDITVGQLLDMTSGIDVSENYKAYWPFTGTARLFLSTDLPGYIADHRKVAFTPGSKGEYRSIDTQMLSMILTEIEDKPLAELASERLWTPLGAGADATWNLDHDGGIEKGYCCFNATALDFARIGQLVLDRGRVDGTRLVSEAWIDRISTPAEHKVSDWGYSAQWWHAPSSDGDFSAIGVYGQYIYVDPDARTVIVKLSDHGTEQDEIDTIDAMRAIAEALGG